MRYNVIECDGCGRNLCDDPYHHEIVIDFLTRVKDSNTSQLEIDTSMSRKTQSTYCDDCYTRLISHIENFVAESVEIEKNTIKPQPESGFNNKE